MLKGELSDCHFIMMHNDLHDFIWIWMDVQESENVYQTWIRKMFKRQNIPCTKRQKQSLPTKINW